MRLLFVLFHVMIFVMYMAHRQQLERASEQHGIAHHGQFCSDDTMRGTTLYKHVCPKDPMCDPVNPDCDHTPEQP